MLSVLENSYFSLKSDDDGEYWDAEEDYDDYDEYGSVVRFRFRFRLVFSNFTDNLIFDLKLMMTAFITL